MPTLFDPLPIGPLTLRNRIVMAPLTRARAGAARVPNAMMAEYYAQRAGAGLILSEATSVTPMGVGYADTPGIWNDAQVQGWKLVTKAVHDQGGLIFLQLWHVGRISDPQFLDGELPVAPSAIKPAGTVSLVRPKKEYVTPRALETGEIPGIVEAYRQGAENARRAGFDGVEIHGANGYLIDQFLQDGSNRRTDQYGGPIENRARLLNEIADAVIGVWGADRVGLHLAPRGDSHDMGDSDPRALFTHVARQMRDRGLAFICLREHPGPDSLMADIKAAFGGLVIANEGLTRDSAADLIRTGRADAAAFGRDFIATPDLPRRLREDLSLNQQDPATFYGSGPQGYVDYPVAEEVA
ncbi:alkene reductase [Paracoccus sediminis]|uniref:2,4-dienoyl-CoA reductase n=1 Tax=Paracoccus sediminis TaxID=1214787 RepID=A0A238XQP7_9RHOB|nr:alkene reductase [Paracoccus sediminis]TBN48214.1 alkene reductase [Paracoccus sediminis]SNR60861.1 2,4-dienoyl-CoA reductase [Paracoccus sediminis]